MPPRRIFYFCYDSDQPSGGQKHTYQHVDVLNRGGFDARVVHRRDRFRLTWFDNDTRVNDYSEFVASFDPARDFVVLPEDMGPRIVDVPGKKVVFNKGIFYGFGVFGLKPPVVDPYMDRDVVAALVVSDHNARQLRYAYPQLDVYEVVMDLRPDVFSFRPLREKAREVATVGKGRHSAVAYQIFRARAAGGHVPGGPGEWVFIEEPTERGVAEVLGRALVFVFQNVEEGLGRMPLEGILCGCVVITYAAGPLKEILPPELCCEYGNPAELSRRVEQTLARYPDGLADLQSLVLRTRERVLRYSTVEQERSVCTAWESIFKKN